MSFCRNCGAEIGEARFCPKCGTPVDGSAENIQATDSVSAQSINNGKITITPEMGTEPNDPQRKLFIRKRLNKGTLVGVLGGIATIILIVSLVAANSLNSEEKENVKKTEDTIAAIGEVTLSSNNKIKAAEKSYSDLSPKEQRHVKNRRDLDQDRIVFDQLKATEVDEMISALGEINLDSGNELKKIENKLEQLTENQKKLLKNQSQYASAEEEYKEKQIAFTEDKIDAIGTIEANEQTKEALRDARKAYVSLDEELRPQVSNYNLLSEAEQKYDEVSSEECTKIISAIQKVTLENSDQIKEAENYYGDLSEEAKKLVTNAERLKEMTEELSALEKAEEERKKILNPGDVINAKDWEITFVGSEITDRIKPNDMSGYYWYKTANEGSILVDMVFKIKNVGTSIRGISDILDDATLQYGTRTLEKTPTLFESSGSYVEEVYDWDGLEPLSQGTLHIAYAVPIEAQTNDVPISVNLTLCGQKKIVIVRSETM